MRPVTRISVLLLAFFLACAPAIAPAQYNSNPSGGTTSGSSAAGANGATNGSSSTSTTTTTTTDQNNVPWTWIIIGAVALVVIVGLVTMSNGRTTSTTIRRE